MSYLPLAVQPFRPAPDTRLTGGGHDRHVRPGGRIVLLVKGR